MKNYKVIVVSILVVGLVVAVLAGLMKLLKGDVYKRSVKAIEHDYRVKRILGKKLEYSFFVTGNMSETPDGGGAASFQYDIDGSKKGASVFVQAERESGKWYLIRVVVKPDKSDERIYVVGAPEEFR